MLKTKLPTPHVPYSSELGDFFKNQRQKAGLSQWDLAAALGYETAQVVSNWERGVQSPPFSKVLEICKVLKISHDSMIRKLLNVQQGIYLQSLKGTRRPSVAKKTSSARRAS